MAYKVQLITMISLLIYRISLLLLLPVVLGILVIRSRNNKGYRQRLPERLGFISNTFAQGGITVHAASVGEVIALKSVIDKLLTDYPHLPITITTFTPTGSAQVKKMFANKVQHSYLPLDIMPCTALFLRRLQPQLMIFMETELWPNLVAQCQQQQIKLLLINGRLSQRSLNSYQKFSTLMTPCLNRFDKILTQSTENLNHFIQLGAEGHRCANSGNLKFDIQIDQKMLAKKTELAALLPQKESVQQRRIWLVASTHDGDELIAIKAFKGLLADHPDLLLVLVPRHPERFSAVATLCKDHGLTLAKRSEKQSITDQHIWLLDSLGELTATFDLSDIVTMGGSFSHIGGHNPLEPALFSKPIIVGSNMSNFNEIMQQLRHQQAIIELTDKQPSEQLSKAVDTLLNSQQQCQKLGQQALHVVQQNQGASDITMLQIQKLVTETNKQMQG
jgi:3-deoxy-D-manno-octulosonic-acid transferase